MKREFLGEFEELVLTMVAIVADNAYAQNVKDSLKEHLGRVASLSAVHITLYRLEDKGLLKSSVGGATAERGGRRKRFFSVTNAGISSIRYMKETRTAIWKMIPQLRHH